MPSDFTLPGTIRRELKPAVKGLRTRLEKAACLRASPNVRFRLRSLAGVADALMAELVKLETEARAAAKAACDCVGPCPNLRPGVNCQNGGDVCLAGHFDGICCPEDSCDIDDGIRKDPTRAAARASEARQEREEA